MLTRAQDDANLRESDAQCSNDLHQVAVTHWEKRAKLPRRGPEPGNAHRNRRFPAALKQVLEMRSEGDRVLTPRCQAKERANPNAPKASIVAALWTSEPPVETSLRSGGVHFGINRPIIGFLINDEPFRARYDDRKVFLGFHRPDLNCD